MDALLKLPCFNFITNLTAEPAAVAAAESESAAVAFAAAESESAAAFAAFAAAVYGVYTVTKQNLVGNHKLAVICRSVFRRSTSDW